MKRIMSFGEFKPGLEPWFSHLAVVTLDKVPNLLELTFSFSFKLWGVSFFPQILKEYLYC